MKRKLLRKLLFLSMFMFFVTGCIPGDGSASPSDPSGFFSGIWHGWIAPVSLIMSLFSDNIRIYEYINSGWWYDFGYYMAVISGFGGLSFIRRKKFKRE